VTKYFQDRADEFYKELLDRGIDPHKAYVITELHLRELMVNELGNLILQTINS